MKSRVAIQGGPGSFSALAAETLFGRIPTLVHCDSFDATLEVFLRGDAGYLVLPWWNRCIGAIREVGGLVKEHRLSASEEIEIPVNLCLIGKPARPLTGNVYSHPAALSQCKRFFQTHTRLRARPDTDTADSLRRIHLREAGFAISSQEAATRYDLPVIEGGIQDRPDNYTLFRLYESYPRT